MTRNSENKGGEAAGARWASRLTAYLLAVAALLMASAFPLGVGPPPDRGKAKVAEVASADYAAAADVAPAEGAPLDEQPSFVARFFKQLRSAVGGAMIGLAVALGQPPEEPFRDRSEGPCEVVPGEDIGDDITYIEFDDAEFTNRNGT